MAMEIIKCDWEEWRVFHNDVFIGFIQPYPGSDGCDIYDGFINGQPHRIEGRSINGVAAEMISQIETLTFHPVFI